MSGFVSMVATGIPIIDPGDNRLLCPEYSDAFRVAAPVIVGLYYDDSDFLMLDDWVTDWWPSSSALGNATGVADVAGPGIYYQRIYATAGCNGRFSYAGFTRNEYGSIVPGCTVRCFRVSTGEMVAQVTSDPATGAFIATTPYNEAHFLTVHKTGPPDIAGASIDSLLPA